MDREKLMTSALKAINGIGVATRPLVTTSHPNVRNSAAARNQLISWPFLDFESTRIR
jgi:hypothetical protein